MNINSEQRLNMLAIEMLEQEGQFNPTQQQIDRMEWHLQRMRETNSTSLYVENNTFSRAQ